MSGFLSIGLGRSHIAKKRRSYNVRLIRRDLSYTVQEIGELLGVHPQAVRRWLRAGLTTIDSRKPFLVHRSELIEFLRNRKSARKRPCRKDQFFCCRCRAPRRPQQNRVEITIRNSRQLSLAALCENCGARMNRLGTADRLPEYRKTFLVETMPSARLREDACGLVSDHFSGKEDGPIQS